MAVLAAASRLHRGNSFWMAALAAAAQQGRLMRVISWGLVSVIRILIVGMLVLTVAGVAFAKAPSAEELASAAQAFYKAQQKGRLME